MSTESKRKRLTKESRQRAKAEANLPKPPEDVQSSGRKGWLEAVLFLAAAIAAASFVCFLSPNIPDFDPFYHLRHASIYAEKGPFIKEFPWVAYSVINSFSADIWYGLHLLLIPITFIPDGALQLKAAGVLLLTLLLLLFYAAMRQSRISYPFLWPFILLFSAGVIVWRLTATRPHILSMGLIILLLSVLVSGSVWAVFLISLAIAFFHLSFFWLAIVTGITVALIKLRTEKIFEWQKGFALLLGLAAGWLLRPNPIGAAKILNVQLFMLLFEKQKGLLQFGSELAPLDAKTLFILAPFFAIWLGLVLISLAAVFLRRAALAPKSRTLLWSSLVLSVVFFEMTFLVSKRSLDQWAPFAVIFAAAAFTCLLVQTRKDSAAAFGRTARIAAISVGAAILPVMLWMSIYSYARNIGKWPLDAYRFQAAAGWLSDHSQPDEIVFHADWDNFPELFYWNWKNRYIGGMDPVFQYAYDPDLYWKAHHLAVGDAASHTWGQQDSAGAKFEETYTVLRRDFKASYIFLEKRGSPAFFAYLSGDPRFVPCFDDGRVAVFRLSDSNP
jgi:hypothetical protein